MARQTPITLTAEILEKLAAVVKHPSAAVKDISANG